MGKGLSNFGGKQAAPFKKGGGRVARKRAVAKGMVKAAKSAKESDLSRLSGNEIDLGLGGAKWHHGWIPANAAAEAEAKMMEHKIPKGFDTAHEEESARVAKGRKISADTEDYKGHLGKEDKEAARGLHVGQTVLVGTHKHIVAAVHPSGKVATMSGDVFAAHHAQNNSPALSQAEREYNQRVAHGEKNLSNVDLAHSKADPKINPATGKPWTEAEDDAWDKAHGIEDGSPEDCAIDQIRGIHDDNEHDLSNGYQPKPYDANGEGADEHIRCPHCHKGNADDARYCDQCGFKLVGAEGVTDMSNLDLSTLTTKERKALDPSDFVFPGKRAYPIHDLAHARDALARSSGKPEAPAVRAAVMKRYPQLRKG